MENIRQRGAMDKLISDRAQEEVNHKVKEILRTLCIGDWQSEPYHEHQNPAERRYQTIKHAMNVTMDRTGAPPYMWFLCLAWVCAIYNSLYEVLTLINRIQTRPQRTNDNHSEKQAGTRTQSLTRPGCAPYH